MDSPRVLLRMPEARRKARTCWAWASPLATNTGRSRSYMANCLQQSRTAAAYSRTDSTALVSRLKSRLEAGATKNRDPQRFPIPFIKLSFISGAALFDEKVEDLFVALEWRNDVGAGKLGARPIEHAAAQRESAIARGGAGRFHFLQHRRGNGNSGDFVVQAQGLLVAGERPHADHHGNRRRAAQPLQERMPVLGIEERLGHGKVGAGFDLGVKALDLVVEVFGDGVERDADGEVSG